MEQKIIDKLELLKKKKEEYIDQVKCINGAIQVLEELLNSNEITQYKPKEVN